MSHTTSVHLTPMAPGVPCAATPPPHWAGAYIGRGYRRGAVGPQRFDCWGLVVHVMRERFDVHLPVFLGHAGPLIAEAVHSGWARVPTPEQGDPELHEGDVLLGRTDAGRHAGLVVFVRPGRPQLLHASSGGCGGVGGVDLEPLLDVVLRMTHPVFWRRPDGGAA